MVSINESFRDVIQRYLTKHQMSIRQLAKQSDVDYSHLNRFLSGQRDRIGLDVAQRLCQGMRTQFRIR